MTTENLITPAEVLISRFKEVESEAKGLAMLMAEKMAEITVYRFENNTEALLTCIDPVNTFSDRTFELSKKAGNLYKEFKKHIDSKKKEGISITDTALGNIEELNRLKQELENIFGNNAKEDDNIFDLNETLPNLQRSLVKALVTTNGYEVLSRRRLYDGRYYVLPKNEEDMEAYLELVWENEYFQNLEVSGSSENDLFDRRKKAEDEIIAFHLQHNLYSRNL